MGSFFPPISVNGPFYRPAVAAIVQNSEGHILIGERSDRPGTWQLPQGGRSSGETLEESLWRELEEETSLKPSDCTIIGQYGPYCYLLPADLIKEGYRGQEHFYFLLQLVRSIPSTALTPAHQEFRTFRWIDPSQFQLNWLPPMKRTAYQEAFKAILGIAL